MLVGNAWGGAVRIIASVTPVVKFGQLENSAVPGMQIKELKRTDIHVLVI